MLAILSLTAFAVAVLANPVPDVPTLSVELGTPGLNSGSDVMPPDLTTIYINNITYGGSGCPQGTVAQYISADRHTFTIIFDEMIASLGGGASITNSRKDCQINLDLHYPQGFTYSVFNTEFRGYADIPTGFKGVQRADYYFSGMAQTATAEYDFTTAYDDDYSKISNIDVASLVWAPCGANLPINIKSEVRLTGAGATTATQALLTIDTVDGNIQWIAGIQWQKC